MTDAAHAPGVRIPDAGGAPRLPRPPGVIRRFWARHPWLTDSLIAAFYLLPTMLGSFAGQADAPPVWVIVLRLVAVAVAGASILLLRRRHPWSLIFVAWGVCLVVFPFGIVDTFPILLALYALAVYRSTKAAWLGFAGSVAIGTLASYLDVWAQDLGAAAGGPETVASASQHTVLMLIATLIGVTVGNRRRYVDALIARAHDLARERDQHAQLATALERARIAREMHDIVSHGLTVMVTLASGSAAVAERDPARAAETMERVAETGRTALSDMRRMLGVLTASQGASAELAPMPGSAAIPDLVETFQAAGLPVRLTTSGPPVADPNLELTVYRIVQEALTNVLRHANRPQRVDVVVEHADGALEVRVTDDGAAAGIGTGPADADAGAPHGGHGLVGMRERVLLYGGTFEAGPRPRAGWQLRARLSAGAGPVTALVDPPIREREP
ncbi:sensor histidine kinase [Agromyces silvae]|uniref:sensor histidine kinase n=1 Tax=Agromyces silvae TaxID=3388266 RepID=UPI00280B0B34|nr:sensor histidine kinase [Agromyces protaetiae]